LSRDYPNIACNVPRTREVAMQAKRVLSAKIEFIRENRDEATQNQQFLVTAVSRRNNDQS